MATDELLAKWEIIRTALKHGASFHAKDGRYWLLMPDRSEIIRSMLKQHGARRRVTKDGKGWLVMWVSPAIAPHVISHPAVVTDDDPSASHRCFHWRPPSGVLQKIPNPGWLQ
jgi:hypothetical protein